MPSKSKKQEKFMAAAAHNPEFAEKAGISQGVAKEFNNADKRKKKKKTTEAEEIRDHIDVISEAVQPYSLQGNRAEFTVQRTVDDTIEVTFDIGADVQNVARVDFDSSLFGENTANADRRSAMDIFQTLQSVVLEYYNTNKGSFVGFNYEAAMNNADQRLRIYDSIAERMMKKLGEDSVSFYFDDGPVTYVLFADAAMNIWGQEAYDELVRAYGEPS